MLPVLRKGEAGPLLVMLHWLGGGAQTWTEVADGLAARGVRCVAVDLPGFGNASADTRYDVASMANAVTETVQQLRADIAHEDPAPWLVAGHSMGGTVAAVVARRALQETPGLENLQGLILVSASPPGPEPMSDEKRAGLLASLGENTGDPVRDRALAATFVDENTGKLPLPPHVRDRAITGVLAANRAAFRHWLERGSNEDWRGYVADLPLPALIFAGTEDEALGEAAQREHTVPHFEDCQVVTLQAAGHLAPLERPGELIEYITGFMARLGLALTVPLASPSPKFLALLGSEFVSPTTRDTMLNRLADSQDWNHPPQVFSPAEFRTLRSLAARIVPDAGFDVAARLDHELSRGQGDGWRFAALPPDREAWRRGLRGLDLAASRAHGVAFLALYPDQQDALLQHAAAGSPTTEPEDQHAGEPPDAYTAEELKIWFQDVRSELARLYMGDPRTMDRIGYRGFADDLGFTHIRLGEREEFEP